MPLCAEWLQNAVSTLHDIVTWLPRRRPAHHRRPDGLTQVILRVTQNGAEPITPRPRTPACSSRGLLPLACHRQQPRRTRQGLQGGFRDGARGRRRQKSVSGSSRPRGLCAEHGSARPPRRLGLRHRVRRHRALALRAPYWARNTTSHSRPPSAPPPEGDAGDHSRRPCADCQNDGVST